MSNLGVKVEETEKISLALQNTTFINRNNIHSDTTENWNAQSDLVGQKDHIYIYTDYTVVEGINIPALKVGDGNAYLIDSPFILSGDSAEEKIDQHIADTASHVSAEDRELWNNKVTCYVSSEDSEALVFTKESEE